MDVTTRTFALQILTAFDPEPHHLGIPNTGCSIGARMEYASATKRIMLSLTTLTYGMQSALAIQAPAS